MQSSRQLPQRIVIDSSTLIGAMLRTQSLPARALGYALENCILYASDETLIELANVVQRPGFEKYLPLIARQEFFQNYARKVTVVAPFIAVTDCRDPKDNKFLELALHSQAEVIISSDDDLLALDPWRGVRVLNPSGFMAWANATNTR
jgi:hypothetical protein